MRLLAVLTLSALTACGLVYAQQGPPSAESFKITNLPDLSPEDATGLEQYAGHIAIDPEASSKLFFWMVSSKKPQPGKNDKLIFWLNGGPGCSSADGYFLESGPLRFVDGKLTVNKGGWHEFATIVFLDQPVGTGLSFTSQQYRENLGEITSDFVEFLKAFFTIFPERSQHDLYLAGESYAGTYIPYFSKAMLDWNDQANEGDVTFQLKGAVIGNGWIDPLPQYSSYIPFVEKHNISTPAMLETLKTQMDICQNDIRTQSTISVDSCERMVYTVLEHTRTSTGAAGGTGVGAGWQCMNQYDIRLKDVFPACGLTWPNELPLMKEYLGRADVLQALHASEAPNPWTECRTRVSMALKNDPSAPAISLLPDLLKRINLLLFSGDHDLICNHIGTEYSIGNMTWNGAKGFENSVKHTWTVDGKAAGEWTEARNLTYVLFSDASHMVPYDAPLAALDMMNRFMALDTTLQAFESSLELVQGEQSEDPAKTGGGENEEEQKDPDTEDDDDDDDDDDEGEGDDDDETTEGEGENDTEEGEGEGGGEGEEEGEKGEEGEEEGEKGEEGGSGDDDDQDPQGEEGDDDDDDENEGGDENSKEQEGPQNGDTPTNKEGEEKEEEEKQGLEDLPEGPEGGEESSSSSGPSGTMLLPLLLMGAGAAFFMYRRRAGKATSFSSGQRDGGEWFPLNAQDDSSRRSSPALASSDHRGGRGRFGEDDDGLDELDELVVESGLRRGSFGDESDDENGNRPRHW